MEPVQGITFQDNQEEIRKNLRIIIRIRWFVSPSILLIMVLAGVTGMANRMSFTAEQIALNGANVVIMLLLNLTYSLLVKRVRDLRPMVVFQLLIDVIHFAFTVYKTGGVTSPFTFLFFFVIFSAALLASSRSAYLIAGASSILYGAMVALDWYGILPHQAYFVSLKGLNNNPSYFILTVSFTVGSTFAFAALSGFLTNLIRKRQGEIRRTVGLLRERNATMNLLFKTSEALNQYDSMEGIAEFILAQLMEFLKLDRALLYINRNNEKLHLQTLRSKDGKGSGGMALDIPLTMDSGLTARVALEQTAYNIRDPENSELINRELAKKIGLNPFAIAPMVLRNHTVGVIGIDRSFKPIKEEEFQVLKSFANQAAIAIDSVLKKKAELPSSA